MALGSTNSQRRARPPAMAFAAKPYCSTTAKTPTAATHHSPSPSISIRAAAYTRAPRSAYGLYAAGKSSLNIIRLRALVQRIRAQQQPTRRRPEFVPNRVDGPTYVRIFSTTLHDGEQSSGATMTGAEKLVVARKLARLGVDVIEAGFPASSPDDLDTLRSIAIDVGNPQGADDAHVPVICGLSRCNRRDIDAAWEAIRHARRPRMHTFIATSKIHMQHKLRKTPDQVVAVAREMVAYARNLGCADVEFSPEIHGKTELVTSNKRPAPLMFTFLRTPKEMRSENVEALKTLLGLADTDMDALQDSRNVVYITSNPSISGRAAAWIRQEQVFTENDGFYAWMFKKRRTLCQTVLSFVWPLFALAVCLFPVYPYQCKIVVLYSCAGALLFIVSFLLRKISPSLSNITLQ